MNKYNQVGKVHAAITAELSNGDWGKAQAVIEAGFVNLSDFRKEVEAKIISRINELKAIRENSADTTEVQVRCDVALKELRFTLDILDRVAEKLNKA